MFASCVDGGALARLPAKPPDDAVGDGLLQEDGGRLPHGISAASLLQNRSHRQRSRRNNQADRAPPSQRRSCQLHFQLSSPIEGRG